MSVEAKKLIDLTRLSRFKELMDQSVDGKLSKLKIDLIQPVSALPEISEAEEGVLYLVPAKASGEYDLYAKETVDGTAKFVKNSSLSISGDLDGFLLKADADKKYISTASVTDGTITLSRPDGSTVVITVNNVAHATKATQDAAGNTITTTYATKAENNTKANDSDVVHKSGDETIAGTKTFSSQIKGNISGSSTSCTGNSASATKLATARTISLTGAVTGSTSFNGSANASINTTLSNIDASKITSGTIDLARIPKAAIPELKIVANDTARFALTTSDIQNGDTVQVTSTGKMYYVKDQTKLSSEAGYAVYTAGAASSVPWSGVTDKPSSYAPAAHTQAASTITGLATVATSGSYTDLANKPAIPTVNNATLTIQKNGTTVKTFTANASANVTANITVPTKVSELTNDSGFLTSHQSLSNYVTCHNGAQTYFRC